MRLAAGLAGALASLLLASAAIAQESARELELATAYVMVKGPSETTIVAKVPGNLQALLAELDDPESQLSDAEKAWLRTAIPAAAETAASQFDKTLEGYLIDALMERFSEAELDSLLEMQTFLTRADIAAAMGEGSGFAGFEALRQSLSSEDFVTLAQALGSPVVRGAVAITVNEGKRLGEAYKTAFREAMDAQCITAPAGLDVCE
jgi:hypothetical protein